MPLSINMHLLVPHGRGQMPGSCSTSCKRPATIFRSLVWVPYLLDILRLVNLEDMELLHDLQKDEAEERLVAEDPLAAVVF